MRIVASPAFSNDRSNPYNRLLYTQMAALGVEVHEYSWRRLLTGSYHVWHIHWPEAPLNDPNPLRSLWQVGKVLVMMSIARRRGTNVVWTIHNLAAHEEQHPRIAPWFWKRFIRRLDGYISLRAAGQRLALEKFPALSRLPGFVVPLGHFRGVYPEDLTREAARERLGLEPDHIVLGFVGQVRRYKGVLELCAAFRNLGDGRARLVIAGDPRDARLAQELRAAAAPDSRIQLHLDFVPDGELQVYLRAADFIVLPFRSVLNSASAMLALSFDRPIMVPGTPNFAELRDRVGPEWVLTYGGKLSGATLAEGVTWAGMHRSSGRPNLDLLDWPTIARQTAEAFGEVIGRPLSARRARTAAAGPKVSVVIPVYNRPAPVRRAIESVIAQSYQNFEIIVVDDGSTDGTREAVAAITDPRIRLVRHERNRGGSAARNTGIRASSGEFVAFLDSDDEWLPAMLESQLAVFARSSDRLGLVYAGSERIYPDGSATTHLPRRRSVGRALLTANVVGETSVAMVRRSVFKQLGGFDESLPSFQDLDLWLKISEHFLLEPIAEPLVRVMKDRHGNRISQNVRGTTEGRALFCRKHGSKMRREGVLHIFLRESAWIHLRRAADAHRARRLCLASLRAQPLALSTYAVLFLACMPIWLLNDLALWKHKALQLLRPFADSFLARRQHRPRSPVPLGRDVR